MITAEKISSYRNLRLPNLPKEWDEFIINCEKGKENYLLDYFKKHIKSVMIQKTLVTTETTFYRIGIPSHKKSDLLLWVGVADLLR